MTISCIITGRGQGKWLVAVLEIKRDLVEIKYFQSGL
jgi:hypothetical protein